MSPKLNQASDLGDNAEPYEDAKEQGYDKLLHLLKYSITILIISSIKSELEVMKSNTEGHISQANEYFGSYVLGELS
ncbi:unnamed protein product [Allacma fusca]|uniref:Uncharacterized protein n=1 Tax=Allacma fusca TaxID=39272 RepID=A0A8J2LEL0_9HEXA|nr:unnamed protein product [Allacma fusca]